MKNVTEKLIKAIEILADKISSKTDSNDALKYTQASLNAANAVATLYRKHSE
jgi:hypothetical protein